MSRVNGKVALITGGGSGIGLATARAFLGEGATVVITGRDGKKLEQATKDLKGGDRLTWHAADATQVDQVSALVKKVLAAQLRIDILVNNAGANIKERSFRELN